MQHDHFPPKRDERPQFTELIRTIANHCEDDENVHEAIAHCHRLFNGTKIPSEILQLFQMAEPVTATTPEFWVLVHALKRSVEERKQLPVAGA